MSKELEALKEIFNGMYNKQGFIKEFKAIEKALTELEKLKKLIRSLAGNHILSKIEEVFGENNSLVNQIDELKKLVGDKDE